MALPFLLLAAQAAGIAMDLRAQKKREQITMRGYEIEQKELDLQMQQEQLASTEESLLSTERLRETMAYQRAVFASRGQAAGQGSALQFTMGELGKFNTEERARALSLSFRKHQVESQKRLLSIGAKTQKAERKFEGFKKTLNLLNINELLGATGLSGGSKLNG